MKHSVDLIRDWATTTKTVVRTLTTYKDGKAQEVKLK